ncbi:MAG: hypothetical protein LAP39_15475 [Acidobacteriia bacterium]|nr:hypothetical protein [Terriglobia bacterium]
MIESRCRLPAFETVAPGAVWVQLAAMLVGVARGASVGNPEISVVRVLDPNAFPRVRGHVVCRVAAVASDLGVLAGKRVAGLPMIELVVRRFPFDDVEFRPEVLGVAADAILVAGNVFRDFSVETLLVCKPLPDFSVATRALKFSRPETERMARGTLRRSLQTGMRLRQRSRGDLRRSRQAEEGLKTA